MKNISNKKTKLNFREQKKRKQLRKEMETAYDFTVAIIKSEPKDDYPKYPVADPLSTLPERMVLNLIFI